MYFPTFYPGVRPFEALHSRPDRVDNPLDLSVKQSVGRPESVCAADHDLIGKFSGLQARQLAQPMPGLMDTMYGYKPFDPMGGSATGLLGPSLANAYSSGATLNHLALIPELLQQNREALAMEAPPLTPYQMEVLPYHHMRATIAANQRTYFGHNAVLPPHIGSSYGASIPHISIYNDILNDINRRPMETEKGVFGSLPTMRSPPEPTTRFSDHLQRLREQHVHQNTCSAPCCLPSPSQTSGAQHSHHINAGNAFNCCNLTLSVPNNLSPIIVSHVTAPTVSMASTVSASMTCNRDNSLNHSLIDRNSNIDLSREVNRNKDSEITSHLKSDIKCLPTPQLWTSSVSHKHNYHLEKCDQKSNTVLHEERKSDSRLIGRSEEQVLDKNSKSKTKSESELSAPDVITIDEDCGQSQEDICSQDTIPCDEHKSLKTSESDVPKKSFIFSAETLISTSHKNSSIEETIDSTVKSETTLNRETVSTPEVTTQTKTSLVDKCQNNSTKQLKDYKPVAKNQGNDGRKRQPKETKTVEVQCDGPDWTPIVLPVQLKSKLGKVIRNKCFRNSFDQLDQKKRKKCRQKHSHRSDNRSRSSSASTTSSRFSSPERRNCHLSEDKPKKRLLQCLSNSDGYVADKIKKNGNESNLFASDPSELGREERALQRAIKHFEQLNRRSNRDAKSAPDLIRDQSSKSSTGGLILTDNSDEYQKIIESVVNESKKHKKHSSDSNKKCKRNEEKDEILDKTVEEMETKTKRKLRHRLLETLLEDREVVVVEGEGVEAKGSKTKRLKANKCEDRVKTTSQPKESIQCKQKRAIVSVRRRRFRSGLDMIRHPQRRKKARNNQIQASNKGNGGEESAKSSEDMVQKSNSESGNPSVPTEMKRLMVNKALGETLLHRAARSNRQDVVQFCLQSNSCDVNARDNANYTPLHECSTRGHLEIARTLLQNGADVNASAAGGIRPLHDAVENNHIEVVRLLLSYGADPNISTYSGATPVQLAPSKAMLAFLKGFLSDISADCQTQDSNEEVLFWKFNASNQFMDTNKTGFDVFDCLPSDVEENEKDDYVFEVSDTPMDPTYRLPNCNSKGSNNFLRLSDALRRTGLTREEFVKTHSEVEIVSVPRDEFERATIGQLVTKWMTSPTLNDGYTEDMVLLDDNLRNVLGIESLRLR